MNASDVFHYLAIDDQWPSLLAALCTGLAVGYLLIGRHTLTPPRRAGMLMFLATMSMQVLFSASQIVRPGATLGTILAPFFWLPLWGLFSLGEAWGIALSRRETTAHTEGEQGL